MPSVFSFSFRLFDRLFPLCRTCLPHSNTGKKRSLCAFLDVSQFHLVSSTLCRSASSRHVSRLTAFPQQVFCLLHLPGLSVCSNTSPFPVVPVCLPNGIPRSKMLPSPSNCSFLPQVHLGQLMFLSLSCIYLSGRKVMQKKDRSYTKRKKWRR